MNPDEVRSAIHRTKAEIVKLKQKIEETSNPEEKNQMIIRLRELRFQQLKYIDRLG